MKKIQFLPIVMLLALLLASCSSDSFKIDGEIANLNGGFVAVVFSADSGMVDERVEVDKKGHFTFRGEASNPVIVNLADPNGEPLVNVAVVNGDHLKVKGDASKPMSIKVKGNRLNEDWQLFRDEHAAFYSNANRLDAAIEKYVREHPADMLSTVLLMADYTDHRDRDKIDKMLKGIDIKARPESLLMAYRNSPAAGVAKHIPRVMSLTLVKHGGGFEEIKMADRISLINFWTIPDRDRKTLIDKLAGIDEGIRVLDVLTESDTLRWHMTIAEDPKAWQHYWAPGGPLEQGIQLFGITSIPWFAVTDSTCLVIYNGPSIDAALKAAQDKLKPQPK
jgi:hypothetical protein